MRDFRALRIYADPAVVLTSLFPGVQFSRSWTDVRLSRTNSDDKPLKLAIKSDGGWHVRNGTARGGDVISLVGFVHGLTNIQAYDEVARLTGYAGGRIDADYLTRRHAELQAAATIQTQKFEAEQRAAAKKSAWIWPRSIPIRHQSEHAYLITKGIQPHGARLWKGLLTNPVYSPDGELVNLQFIAASGEKRFLTGGMTKGCYHAIGEYSGEINLCEGFATGCSVHEFTGQHTVIAYGSTNLSPVAVHIRNRYPEANIVIYADNDPHGLGQKKATDAAEACKGGLIIPPSTGDFNDFLNFKSLNTRYARSLNDAKQYS